MTALEKAQNLLAGAEACWQGQSMEGCALCCYAAMFWAAIAILEHFGIKQMEWSHGGLRNRFGLELIKRRRVLSERFGEYLGFAYRLRDKAHYGREELSRRDVEKLLAYTRQFVQAVSEVIRK
jgi:uncharacterized protein (UPF0332 family)